MNRDPRFNNALHLVEKHLIAPGELYGFSSNVVTATLHRQLKQILNEMLNTYVSKDTDYAQDGKPMGNLRGSEELGVPAWKGVLVRISDKKQRVGSFIERGSYLVEDEKIHDTLIDAANYCLLGMLLLEEEFPTDNNSDNANAAKNMYMMSARAIHCHLLYDAVKLDEQTDRWEEKPWSEFCQLFQEVAKFSRNH